MDESDDFRAQLESIRQGDADARDAVIEGVLPRIEAYVRLNVGPGLRARESCSDLVQTICREVLLDVGQFEGDVRAQFHQWVVRVAERKIQSRHRAMHAQRRDVDREVPLEAPGPDGEIRLHATYGALGTPSQDLSMREAVRRIETAIDRLPDEQRRVLTMSRILGLGYPEIARELGKEEAAVRKTLSRARARLSRWLAFDEPAR